MPSAAPVRIGFLYDYPQGDGGKSMEQAFRLGFDTVAASGRVDRDVELVANHARGLPAGTEHDVVTGFKELEAAGSLLVVGPSISDNGLITAPLFDHYGLPSINYTGGERTRGVFGFHYQVGSLEEEPAVLAARLAQRGLRRPAIVHDQSPVGKRYAECFDDARGALGLETAGSTAISSMAEDLSEPIARLRDLGPDSLVYLGLGMSSRAVALAVQGSGWDIPVVANSALMFGYAFPDWRDGYRGWEYLDAIADDNVMRAHLREQSAALAAGPVSCAMYDIGRLVGEALARADHLTRDGLRQALERVKMLPATCGREGTIMSFGVWDHAALKGEYLVLREWRDGETVQVDTDA
jgi:ABC-type branched-subunit amino acid transport system substrate-binding protein